MEQKIKAWIIDESGEVCGVVRDAIVSFEKSGRMRVEIEKKNIGMMGKMEDQKLKVVVPVMVDDTSLLELDDENRITSNLVFNGEIRGVELQGSKSVIL